MKYCHICGSELGVVGECPMGCRDEDDDFLFEPDDSSEP